MALATVPEIVADLKAGRMVVLVDEETARTRATSSWRRISSRPRRSTSWPRTRAASSA
jgi:hypothetical protein